MTTIPTLREALAKSTSVLEDARRYIQWQVEEGGSHHPTMPSFVGKLVGLAQSNRDTLAAVDQAVEALAGPEVGDGESAFKTWWNRQHQVWRNTHDRSTAKLTFLAGFSAASIPQPIDILLFCPKCGMQHIDEAEPQLIDADWSGPNGWDNPPHKSHLCHGCGCIWRPADVPTNGVENIATSGMADNWAGTAVPASTPQPEPAAGGWRPIKTAPKRKTALLVCGLHSDGSPWWNIGHTISESGIVYGDWDDDLVQPAYWQPLDAPPSATSPSDDVGSHLPPLIAEFERREDHFRERYGSGKWMVLWGDGLRWTVGDSFAEAADWALKKFGPNPRVLIRQIDAPPVSLPFAAASPSPPGLDEGGVEAAARVILEHDKYEVHMPGYFGAKEAAHAAITAYLEATHGR